MRNEIDIEISVLKGKKMELQLDVSRPFRHGRDPADAEYAVIGTKCEELRLVEAQLAVVSDLKEVIKANKS